MTGKQKSYLRSLAQEIKPTFQIGKEAISDNMLTDIRNYLNKHELMKISVLQNCEEELEDLASVFEDCGFIVVQIIGRTIILYMHSKNAKNPIVLPR